MKTLSRIAAVAALLCVIAGASNAQAAAVRFVYRGGAWSHAYHTGWTRYWGGPTIGFYFAPAPVYVVAGYTDPCYYTGPDFWYSNPSFGLSIQIGGGGYSGGGYYATGRYDRGREYSRFSSSRPAFNRGRGFGGARARRR